MGGIYPKGEFLTTFAERSPEAAIPIDNSQRAKDLWLRTGQMLGLIQGNTFYDRVNQHQQLIEAQKFLPQIQPMPRRFPLRLTTPPYAPQSMQRQRRIPIYPQSIQRQSPFRLTTPPYVSEPARLPIFNESARLPELMTTNNLMGGALPEINVTINVTINGNADEASVQRGIENTMPALRRSFAEELAAYNHERARRSYA